MINLCIIRHAHALPLSSLEIKADEDRPLSDQGRGQVAALGFTLHRLGISFDRIVTSPLVRAVQTAEGLQRLLVGGAANLETSAHLSPGGSPKKLAKLLRRISGDQVAQVALVGHEPDLSSFLAWLIGGKRARIELAKAGMAWVVCDSPPRKGAGRLEWLVTPAWCGQEVPTHTSP